MARLKLIVLMTMMMASSAFAKDVSFKYKLNLLFGMTASCTDGGEKELSQVRFNIDADDLKSNKDFVLADVRVTACVIVGDPIKERYSLMVPRFMFAEGSKMQGVFNVNHAKFAKVSVNEARQGTYQVRFIEKNGQPWKQIDPIELSLSSKGPYPERIRFFVTSKGKWLDAGLRLIEGR